MTKDAEVRDKTKVVGTTKEMMKDVDKKKLKKEATTTMHVEEDTNMVEMAGQIGTMLIVMIVLNMVIMFTKLKEKEMASKKMVHGLPSIDSLNKFCELCMIGKYSRSSFPRKAKYRTKKPLNLIHTNICRPIKSSSIDENWYSITFIDDFSCKTWVYLLKEKFEVFAIFKKLKFLLRSK